MATTQSLLLLSSSLVTSSTVTVEKVFVAILMPKPWRQLLPKDGNRRRRSSSTRCGCQHRLRCRCHTGDADTACRWGGGGTLLKTVTGRRWRGGLLMQSSCADNSNCGGGRRRYQRQRHGGIYSRHMSIKINIICLIHLCLCCIVEATWWHTKPWNIVIIFTDMMYDDVGVKIFLSGYLYAVTQHFAHKMKESSTIKFPERFLEISCRDLTLFTSLTCFMHYSTI